VSNVINLVGRVDIVTSRGTGSHKTVSETAEFLHRAVSILRTVLIASNNR
jgi:hypothetical protein